MPVAHLITTRRDLLALGLVMSASPRLTLAQNVGGADLSGREGTYFIVSASTGHALQPVTVLPGNNVFLQPFNRGGTQRWVVKPVLDPRTRKPTGRVTIQLDGPTPLYLEPYTVPSHTAVMGSRRAASYQLRPVAGGRHEIRNHQLNGDALRATPVGQLFVEAPFAPSDGSAAFQWDFVPAN